MDEHLPWRAELIDRIRWLVQLRWMAVVGTLGAIIVADARLPGVLPLIPLLALTGFVAVYNIFFYLYAFELRAWLDQHLRLRAATWLVHGQIILDLTCLTLLLHYSGGVESPFAVYYVLHVILASILLARTASFLTAILAIGMYSVLVFAEYAGVVAHHPLVGILDPDMYRRETYILGAVFALATVLLFAAYVASSITRNLRQRERELDKARRDLQARTDDVTAANRKLQELDKAKTLFLLTVTHELRAPVAAIQSYLDLILQGYVAPDRQQQVLHRCRERAAELLALIGDLLQLARIRELDKRKVQAQPVDVAALMVEVAELFRGEAEEKRIELKVHPTTGHRAIAAADPDHVKVIWTNLISNAIKYTPSGGRVTINLRCKDGTVTGIVRDTGIGISAEALPHVFDEFFRTEEAKATVSCGTGLGMSITKRLIEMYGGKIEVQSRAGRGTTFTFSLPEARCEEAPAAIELPVAAAQMDVKL